MRKLQVGGSIFLVGAVLATAIACGGGGGGGGTDVNGWWSWDLVGSPGAGALGGVVYLQVEDTGDTVRIMDVAYPRTGNTFGGRYPEGQPSYLLWDFLIESADSMRGTIEMFSSNVSTGIETYQFLRTTAPTGRLTVSGTLLGEPLGVNAAVAYGTDTSLPGIYVFWVRHDTARDPFYARFRIFLAAPVPTGTYPVGGSSGDVDVEFVRFGRGDSIASSGQLVITSISTTRIAGTFDLDLSNADEVMGNFDVPLQPAP